MALAGSGTRVATSGMSVASTGARHRHVEASQWLSVAVCGNLCHVCGISTCLPADAGCQEIPWTCHRLPLRCHYGASNFWFSDQLTWSDFIWFNLVALLDCPTFTGPNGQWLFAILQTQIVTWHEKWDFLGLAQSTEQVCGWFVEGVECSWTVDFFVKASGQISTTVQCIDFMHIVSAPLCSTNRTII